MSRMHTMLHEIKNRSLPQLDVAQGECLETAHNASTLRASSRFSKKLRQRSSRSGHRVVVILDNASYHHARLHREWRFDYVSNFHFHNDPQNRHMDHRCYHVTCCSLLYSLLIQIKLRSVLQGLFGPLLHASGETLVINDHIALRSFQKKINPSTGL